MRTLLAAALILTGCSKSDPPPKPAEPSSSTDDDSAEEVGAEGDDGDLPAISVAAHGGACNAALLTEASRIVSRARASTYAHKTHIDEAAARYDVDCSGLVDYALARTCPDALGTLHAKRPLAKHFVELLSAVKPGQAHGRWKRVGKAADLAPGDVVAWLKPADVVTNNTGHVMIVRAPVTVTHGEVAVPIIDSTSVRHGADDSRFPTKATGVGTGTIHLVVDDAGAPVGYRWSNGKKARDHACTVALGRLE